MGPCTLSTDVPIGCWPRETGGRLRRPPIRLVGGHRARRPCYCLRGENWATLVFISSVDPPCFSARCSRQARPDPFHTAHHVTGQRHNWPSSRLHVTMCASRAEWTRIYHKHHSNLVRCNEMPCLYSLGRPCAGVLYPEPGVVKFRRLLSATVGSTLLPPPERCMKTAMSVFQTCFLS